MKRKEGQHVKSEGSRQQYEQQGNKEKTYSENQQREPQPKDYDEIEY